MGKVQQKEMSQEQLWNSFFSILGGEPVVKSLRQVVTYLLELIDNPTTSAKDLANIIAADPALATKVLTSVNSPAYGVRNQVSDLRFAISLLGYDQIRDITLNIAIIEKMGKKQGIQMRRMWEHSFYCGKVAEIIAKSLGRLAEEAFTFGLLHDIGKILLAYSNEHAFSSALQNYRFQQGKVLHWQAEKQSLGLSHADLGGLACLHWKLPEPFYRVIWLHHSPLAAGENTREAYLARVIHVADIMCWIYGYPSVDSVNPFLNGKPEACLDSGVLDSLGLEEGKFREIVLDVKAELKRSETIFDWIAGNKVP